VEGLNMMRTHRGVTLFECLIYLALFSFIATASVSIIARLWQSSIAAASIERSRLTLYSAFDALAREVRSAPSLRAEWKLITPTALIWPTKNSKRKDRCWIAQKNRLFRIEGTYTTQLEQWKKKHSSCIAPITNLTFKCLGAEHISHVMVTLSDGITTIQETITLHNRVMNAK